MLNGMVVWIEAEWCKATCAQRARVEAVAVGHVLVTMLGTDRVERFPVSAICGLELTTDMPIKFRITEVETSK